jgi:hypothetical protein
VLRVLEGGSRLDRVIFCCFSAADLEVYREVLSAEAPR